MVNKAMILWFTVLLSQALHAGDEIRPDTIGTPEPDGSAAVREPRFDIWELRVTGNSLLARRDIEQTLYPFLGPDKTIEVLQSAQSALQQRYRDAGYATSYVDIPEQEVVDGVVHLEVTEGQLQRVRISGSRYFSLGRIRAGVPSLQEGETPNLNQVQQELATLNRASPDREIVPALRPGSTPGTLEVELQVRDSFPLHGELEVNNRYTGNTSKTRLNASLRYANLWQREHSLGVSWQISPQDRDEVEVLAATYVWPLEDSAMVLAGYAVDSQSDVAAVGALSVIGQGTILGLRASLPLSGGRNLMHSLSLGMDYKDFEESVNLLGGDTANTPIRYLSLLGQYSATLLGKGYLSRFGASAYLAPRGLVNDEQEFADKRFNANPNYFFLRLNGEHETGFLFDSRLHLALSGQIAGEPLISNEQFSAGGAHSVRGYPESVVLGDDGAQGSLEWRSPGLDDWLWNKTRGLYLALFADGAWVQTRDPLPGESKSETLASYGAGFRLGIGNGLSGDFWWARALRDLDDVRRGDSRVHFSVRYEM